MSITSREVWKDVVIPRLFARDEGGVIVDEGFDSCPTASGCTDHVME
jgi:hypothetical protein